MSAGDSPQGSAARAADQPLRIFIIAGEPSGDQLGGHIMAAIRRLSGRDVMFATLALGGGK